MPRSLWTLIALVAVVATLSLVAPPAPASAGEDPSVSEIQFLDSVNAERARRGLDRFTVASDLRATARAHSRVMADTADLHHNPSLSSQVTGWSRLGENVGRGRSAQTLHRALMNSEGHRANLLSPHFTQVGVGVVDDGSQVWVTQVFRLPRQLTSASFRDLAGGAHASSITRLYEAGLTTGCTARSYCPTKAVTRGQMSSFIARAAALRPAFADAFDDLGRAPAHRHNVNALADAGVTRGCDAERFCPDRRVTRAQMATFLANARGLAPVAGTRFGDVPADAVHGGAINAIAKAGITVGCDDGAYCPDRPVTRAEMATFLVRAFRP